MILGGAISLSDRRRRVGAPTRAGKDTAAKTPEPAAAQPAE